MQMILQGKRILVVEDELFAALELSEMIVALGGAVIGPIATLERAEAAVRDDGLDGAVLDVKLDHTFTTPLVLILAKRGVPVLLSTGYERAMLPAELADFPRLTKPYDERTFRRAAERHLNGAGSSA